MRIVQYLKWMNLREGGTVRAVLDLSGALARAGHEVIILTCDDADVPDPWKRARADDIAAPLEPGVPACYRVRVRDRLNELRGRTAEQMQRDTLFQLLDRPSRRVARQALAHADALHVHGPWASSNLQMSRWARKMRVPYVMSVHGMLDDWCMAQGGLHKRAHLVLLSRSMLEHARAVHCTAQGELAQARRHFPGGHGVVVPLPFDTSAFRSPIGPKLARQKWPQLKEAQTLLFLGRLNEKKGPERLVRAMAMLKSIGQNVVAVFAGPSDPPAYGAQLQALAQELDVADRCIFAGLVTGGLKLSLLEAADLLVLPTSQENFGYVLLEALASGTPVVTTRGVDIWPELQGSGGAVILDQTSREGLAAQVAREAAALLSDRPRLEAMGEQGRAWVNGYADEARIVAEFEAMYRGG